MPGVISDKPKIRVPLSGYYPGLSLYDIPGKPFVFCQVTTEGVTLKVYYDISKTHKIEVFHIIQKDAYVDVFQWEKLTEAKVSNENPIDIAIERPNPRFTHHFTVRGVTVHGINGPFSDAISHNR